MTNKQKLSDIQKRLDNWQVLGLLEHFDLVLNKLPQVFSAAKNRPDEEFIEDDFSKGLTDETDYEPTYDDKLYSYGI